MFLQGLFGKREFLYQTRFLRQFVVYLCSQVIMDQICSNIMLLLGGFNPKNMNMVSGSLVNSQCPRSKQTIISLSPWGWANAREDLGKWCSKKLSFLQIIILCRKYFSMGWVKFNITTWLHINSIDSRLKRSESSFTIVN